MNVVLCEDNLLERQFMVDFMQSKGFNIHPATDGTEALRLVEELEAELVISDIEMAPMDGITFLETLRKNGNNVPFILITGHPEIESYIHATHDLGAFEYLQKPFDLDILLNVINRLLGKKAS